MPQDTFLFSATIKENIRYGKLDAIDEEITAAAQAVSAHDFIMKFDKGYDTDVNERGTHEVLIRLRGVYYNLYASQFRSLRDDDAG